MSKLSTLVLCDNGEARAGVYKFVLVLRLIDGVLATGALPSGRGVVKKAIGSSSSSYSSCSGGMDCKSPKSGVLGRCLPSDDMS